MAEALPSSPMPSRVSELSITVRDGEHDREATLTLGRMARGLSSPLGVRRLSYPVLSVCRGLLAP